MQMHEHPDGSLPVREDGQLDGVACGGQSLPVLLCMHLNSDVGVWGDHGSALRLHYNCADLIQQDGRPFNPVSRPQFLQMVRVRGLATTCLHQRCTGLRADIES